MPTTLANTDPAAWERPFDVDFDRTPRHLTFAYGIHRCIGAPLARRESVIALEELLAALPEFRLQEGVEIVTELGPILQLRNLPLAWGEKKAASVKEFHFAERCDDSCESQPEGKAVAASVEGVAQFLSKKLLGMEPFGKTIKLLLDGNAIVLDGNTNPPSLSRDDSEAQVTVIASLENFAKVLNKKLNPQMAMATGKIKIKGDMMAVMALSKLL